MNTRVYIVTYCVGDETYAEKYHRLCGMVLFMEEISKLPNANRILSIVVVPE